MWQKTNKYGNLVLLQQKITKFSKNADCAKKNLLNIVEIY